jgi:PII-like signaling protein
MTSSRGFILRLHIGERDRFQGRPLHAEILDRCRAEGVEQVCVYRGIEGYGASTRVHRPGLFGRSQDAPIVVTLLADAEQRARLEQALAQIVDEGLVAVSEAEILRLTRPAPATEDPAAC